MNRFALLALLLPTLAACASSSSNISPFPHGEPIQLLDGPVHLGDGQAEGQSFPHGHAVAARVCSLVNMPRSSDVYIQVHGLRQTESLANALTINGRGYPLPMTLERDPFGKTSNAMTASPVQRERLEQGPSEICIAAGQRINGDIDDFELDGLTLYVQGIDPRDVGVRRGLALGAPPQGRPPSTTWGGQQQAPGAPGRWGWGQ